MHKLDNKLMALVDCFEAMTSLLTILASGIIAMT